MANLSGFTWASTVLFCCDRQLMSTTISTVVSYVFVRELGSGFFIDL
jgi:hypothetical protein